MKKVLVADDTKNIRLLLTKCLQMEGYEVVTANDGFSAREILLSDHIDLAFIDIKMPNLSGTEVIKYVREKGITTPIIVITAYATVKNAVECTQMGTLAYLQKPFTAEKIKSVLKEHFIDQIDGNNQVDGLNENILSLQAIRKFIDKGDFLQAVQLLKNILPAELENPEVYLMLSIAYGGLGNPNMEKKFLETYRIFKGEY